MLTEEAESEGGRSAVDDSATHSQGGNPFSGGDPDQIVLDDDLPFTRFHLPPEEEEVGTVQTVKAWVVDITDQRQITKALKWLKQVGLYTPDQDHLKRIKRHNNTATLLVTISKNAPVLPDDLNLPEPYTSMVPTGPALTLKSLEAKNSFWPTVYSPSRRDEPQVWSRGKVLWAWEVMNKTITVANDAREQGELPIAAYIAAPYDATTSAKTFTAFDTRTSTAHPLRHAVFNVIRRMADETTPMACDGPTTDSADLSEARNGQNYLLTSLSLFTTHEPCVMCSMALIHSRVKEVFYLYSMPKTGGCGSITCLPVLKGVNHRFGIFQWKITHYGAEDIRVNDLIDA